MSVCRRAAVPMGLALVGLLAIGITLSGCSKGSAAATKEFERLAQVIAEHTGATASEVETGFRTALKGRNEEELAQAAQRSAERTLWIDTEMARLASNRAATRKVIAESTCEWLELLKIAGMTDQERNVELEKYIVGHIQAAGLPEGDAKSVEIRAGIIAQIESYEQSGQLDYTGALQDAACFLFS